MCIYFLMSKHDKYTQYETYIIDDLQTLWDHI